jgi:MFS family permease
MADAAQPLSEIPDAVTTAPGPEVAAWRRYLIIAFLLTGAVKTTMVFTTVVPVLPMISDYFSGSGDDVLNAQILVTIGPVGIAFSGIIAGWIVRESRLRATLFVSLGLCCLTGLAQLVIDNFYLLLVNRFFLGLTAGASDVVITSILAAQFTGKMRSRLIGLRQAVGSAGTVGTMLLAGWLADMYGWRTPSWMFLFPLTTLFIALIAFNKPIIIEHHPQSAERFSLLQLWPIFLFVMLMTAAHTMPSFQVPFLLRENGIESAVLISRVPALSAFISVLSAMAFGWIYGALGRGTLVLSASAMAIGFVGIALSNTYEMILFWTLIEGVGAGLTSPFFLTRLLDRVNARQRNTAVGFKMTCMFMGHFINPLIVAPLRHSFGIHGAFVAVGGFMMVASAFYLVRVILTRNKETIL